MVEPDDGSANMDLKEIQETEDCHKSIKDSSQEDFEEPMPAITSKAETELVTGGGNEENKDIQPVEQPDTTAIEINEKNVGQDGKETDTHGNYASMESKSGKFELPDNEENKSEHEEMNPDVDDLDNDTPDTPYAIDELAEIRNQESKEDSDHEGGEQKLIKTRLVNPTELGCCEYCQGPVKKRRLCSPLKKFCSKACARNCRRTKKDEEGGQDSQAEESAAGAEGEHIKMTWDDYLRAASSKAAPDSCFKHSTTDVPGLKPGMKLEAVDRNNPPSYCVATVIKCVGHRVCIRYDGYGGDSSNDIWCNFQAEELHPIGWCAQNGYPLQPPKGVGSSLEAWRTFLTQTLTGALAAPQDLFKKSQEHFQPRVHGFEVGMKLEAIHPLRPSIICPATVTKSLGPYYFAVTPDYQHDLPPTTFCCHSDSPGIFPIGWCYRNGIELTYPANYTKKSFSWPKYLTVCRATAAPSQLFKKVKAHKFKVAMKVESVDLEQPAVICVATITNVIGRLLLLFFDGQSRFQFVDVESPDIYPIGWCKRTGHPLVTPFGVMPANIDAKIKAPEPEVLYLPSFDEVMGRQVAALQHQGHLALPSRKPTTKPEPEKDKDKDKTKEREENNGDFESEEKSGESDISEDDSLASERFYHNKNQIFFNKGCCIGPLLNPERVKLLPDATPPGKVSTVIRTGLEMVAKAALDPEKVIDLMQEGCGVRVTIKHEGKLLKKAISRVDSRPKLERYLKRFCRRLICCEYFLSLKPVGQPCPDQCKADDQGNLQGPKGLKAKRSREYFEVKHLGFEKKKRGRRRKTVMLNVASSSQVLKKPILENGAAGSVATVIASSTANRQLAPAYHIPHNGNVMPRPAVTTAAIPGVQSPVVRYPGPGNVAVVRPNTNLHMAVGTAATPIAPAKPPHIVAAQATVQGNTQVAKQDSQLPQNRVIMTNQSIPGSSNKPRIVTNVSGQRFATSSSGSGTTITFGRAPPNVTVSSAAPPPLTRISNTVDKVSASSEKGAITSTNSLQRTVSPKGSGVFSLTSVSHAAHPRGPPNVVVSSSQGMMTSGTTVQVSVSDTSTGMYTSGSAPVSGVIRAPIVVPPQVKQETPPPPPLVHASKVPSGLRMIGTGGGVSSGDVTLSTSSFSHARSLPQKSFPGAPLGESRSPHSIYTSTGHVVGQPMAGQSSRTVYIRPGNPSKGDAVLTSNKHLMPRYQSFAQRISPKPQINMQGNPEGLHLSQDVGTIRHQSPVFTSIGQTSRPVIAAKSGVIQTIHHNPASNASSTNTGKPRGPLPANTAFVQTSTLEKIRAGIKPNASHVESVPIASSKPSYEEDKHLVNDATTDHGEEQNDGKDEPPKKRNLWWLKKRKRKRSRLTYMKTKYRKKDDGSGGVSDENGNKREEHSDYADYLRTSESPDRPKRERMTDINDLVMRFEEDGDGSIPMVDEEDPDWDESVERKKAKQHLKTRKRGFGRNRKEGGSELSPTLSNPPSPFSPTSLHSPVSSNHCGRRTGSKQVATETKSQIMKLEPVPPRRPLNVAVDHNDGMPYKAKSSKSASYSAPDGSGQSQYSTGYQSRTTVQSTSSHTSPISPRSPSFKRQSAPKRVVDVGVNTSLPGCLNGRSPDLPSNPITWSVEQVIVYVRSTDCGHYAPIFEEEEIDGQALLMLSRDALMQFTPMKLGPTLKMCSYISQLKLRAK